MVIMRRSAVALALAGAVSAQTSSVVTVFFPDTDAGQTLVGSLVASDASKTTIAFGCGASVDSDSCGFGPDIVTVTFGSSTFRATETLNSVSLLIDCALTGTTAATCVQTYIGPAGELDDATATDSLTATDTSSDTQITTTATTTVLAQSEINFIPITLTAFASAASGGSASAGTGASGSVSTATSTTASSTTTGNTATHTGGAAASVNGPRLRWIAVGAGLIGLTVIVL